RMVSPDVVVHLEMALHDKTPKVRRTAVLSTKNLVWDQQQRLLAIVVDDPDLSVQQALIKQALSLLSFRYASETGKSLQNRIICNIRQKDELRQTIFDIVADNTQSMNRYEAIQIAGTLNDPRSIPYLIQAMKDRKFYFREEAATVLGKFDDPQAVKALVKALSD